MVLKFYKSFVPPLEHIFKFQRNKNWFFVQEFLHNKFAGVLKWYDEFTGMDEVRKAQNKVIEEETNFKKVQEARRDILLQVNEIQGKIKELYNELDTVNRGDARYIHLITKEHKLLKEEKIILEQFSLAEKDERDCFAALSNSLRLSHEKERAQSERTKYWSIIGSVLGTVIGIVGSSINNHFKLKEFRELIKNSSNEQVINLLKKHINESEKFLGILENSKDSTKSNGGNEKLLLQINSRLNKVENILKKVILNDNDVKSSVSNETHLDTNPEYNSLAAAIQKELVNARILLCTLAFFTIAIPLMTKF